MKMMENIENTSQTPTMEGFDVKEIEVQYDELNEQTQESSPDLVD